jgi:hypothetical protein
VTRWPRGTKGLGCYVFHDAMTKAGVGIVPELPAALDVDADDFGRSTRGMSADTLAIVAHH